MIQIKKPKYKDDNYCSCCRKQYNDVLELSFTNEGCSDGILIKLCKKCRLELFEKIKEDKDINKIIYCKDCKHHWVHRCMDSIPIEICDLNQTFYDAEVDFCSLADMRGERDE